MATLREYFENDFGNCVKVQVKLEFNGQSQDAVILYDFSGCMAYFAIYLASIALVLDDFYKLIGGLEFGKTEVKLAGGVMLPSANLFPGALEIKNDDPFEIRANFFGDPEWASSTNIQATRRVFLYSETDLPDADVATIKGLATKNGLSLQFRSLKYRDRRTLMEKPLAFISHDSRDKEVVAKKIAFGLQRMICPVWYDEYSLKVGQNLRKSIEAGLKECKKCVLVLSPNFISNKGWTKKEFDSIFTREILEEQQLVLPVWFNVTKQQVYEYSPSLLNVKGVVWGELGEDEVCRRLHDAISS